MIIQVLAGFMPDRSNPLSNKSRRSGLAPSSSQSTQPGPMQILPDRLTAKVNIKEPISPMLS